MNKRIKELAEQAGMTDDKFGMFFAKDFESHCADGVDLEKFAELIVQECAEVAKGGSWYYDAPSCGWRNPINFVCGEMKQHFGIEE